MLVVVCALSGSAAMRSRPTAADTDSNEEVEACVDEAANPHLNTIKQFKAVAMGAYGAMGQVAGGLAYNLEEGVQGSLTGASLDGLKLTVTHNKVNEGEVATPSKVPVQWHLEETTTYSLESMEGGHTMMKVTGIKLLPHPEGLKWYQNSGVAAECQSAGDLKAQVTCEKAALYKWFEKYWKTVKTTANLKDHDNKLSRIIYPMYGATAKYYGIRAGGSDSWPSIVYSLATVSPSELDYFELKDVDGKEDSVEIGMAKKDLSAGTPYEGLLDKVDVLFDAEAFEGQRRQGERFARSGLNFGAMAAAGTYGMETVRGGTAKYILKLTKPCASNKKDKYDDWSEMCQDSEGRIHWYA